MKQFGFLALLAVLGGCTGMPKHAAPNLEVPSRWTATATQASVTTPMETHGDNVPARGPWWQALDDPLLATLLDQVASRNLDLDIARARIVEARASQAVAAAALAPSITGTIRTGRRNTEPLGREQATSLFEGTFDATWELDMFGASAARNVAALASVRGMEYDREDVLASLRAEVARHYIDLRNAQERLQLGRETLASSRTLAQLVASLRSAGLRSELDAAQAQSLVFTLEAKLPALETAVTSRLRRIEMLLGHPPGRLDDALATAGAVPRAKRPILIEEPARVLARRPDVQRAERQLAAATSIHRAALADRYPKLSIGALVGIRDSSGNASLGLGALSGGLLAPVFNAGRLRAESDAADARREQAQIAYRASVLEALEDVEVRVVAYFNADRNRRTVERLVESESLRLALAEARYRGGIAGFSDVLDAQRALYAARAEQSDARAEAARGYVALAKSLGG